MVNLSGVPQLRSPRKPSLGRSREFTNGPWRGSWVCKGVAWLPDASKKSEVSYWKKGRNGCNFFIKRTKKGSAPLDLSEIVEAKKIAEEIGLEADKI